MRGYPGRLRDMAVALVLLALVPACGSSSAATPTHAASAGSGPFAIVGKQAPDFSLVDQFDHRQHLSAYRGKVVLLTFVSSHCTTVCPLTAEMLSRTQDLLGAKAREMQLVAVNANEIFRSVGDVLRWSKLHSMTDRWLFLTGSLHKLVTVYADYGVSPGSAHTVVVYAIDPQGRVRTAIPIAMKKGLDAEARVVAKYVRMLESSPT
jgi:cytochrome oxidase Cu insertion factor (SCO1/SenC/PrrC family)